MPTDAIMQGVVKMFEDFLVTAIGDLPEIDNVAVTGETRAVVNDGEDGRLRLAIAASNDDEVGAVSLGDLNWKAGVGPLYMEARCKLSSITDNKYFVGFGDSAAAAAETSFDATSDVVDILTMSDGFGILFDSDATTKNLWCVAGATDVATVKKSLNAKYNPGTTNLFTLGCYLSTDRKSAAFYVNGEEVYRVDSTTVLVGAVALVPGVWAYEQGTAFNLDVDYIYAEKGRSQT